MIDVTHLPLFLFAAFVLLITPGPAVLYIVTRSIDRGRTAGLISVLSVELGTFVHVFAATFGLSALLVSSAMAFAVVKYLGAIYLIVLGVRRLTARAEPADARAPSSTDLRRTFWQGFFVAMLNPKTALFFLAFLPQFVSPARGPVAAQMLVLGLLFVLMPIVTDSCYALLARAVGPELRRSVRVARIERYGAGGVYIGLGLTAAFADRR